MYVPLHVHTHYSLLDSILRPDELFNLAAEMGMPAVAITEHGNMHSVVKCYEAAKSADIKFIPGIEVYHTPDCTIGQSNNYHLTLIAESNTGYHNLCKLSTISYQHDHFFRKPRIDYKDLGEYSEGIICLTGCLSGIISKKLLNEEDPREDLEKLLDIFGKNNVFVEVWDHRMQDQRIVVPKLMDLAKEYDIQVVATTDCHYLKPEDHKVHSLVRAVAWKSTPEHAGYSTQEFYFRHPDAMQRLWKYHPAATKNTLLIAERCSFTLETKKHYPVFSVESEPDNIKFFAKLVKRGIVERYGKNPSKEVIARVKHEAKVIRDLGYIDYFLILWDLMDFTRKAGIPIGPGRGSACGSIISYVLRITDLDPIAYGLLFERFLNMERTSVADIDIDVAEDRRDEVIQYFRDKYGDANVARIGTFSHMHGKSTIKDVGKALGYSYEDLNSLCKLFPEGPAAIDFDIRQFTKDKYPQFANTFGDFNDFIAICHNIIGQIRHKGSHAAGVIIGDQPLTELIPLCRDKKGIVTQYDMTDSETVGLLKIDILGLKTLSVIHHCISTIPEDIRPSLNTIPLDDKDTYDMLSIGMTCGVFQLESFGMRLILSSIKPTKLEDIAVTNALYRPGPLGSGMVEEYIARRQGTHEITYLHPCAKDILDSTYGTLIYQEQVMLFSQKLCGYTLGQADCLRKAIGKKKLDLLAIEKDKFIKASQNYSKVSEEEALEIWSYVQTFGSYGFNLPHATSYGLISYYTAYLKRHFAKEFMASLMTWETAEEKLQQYVYECVKRLGILVFPPDVNKSDVGFVVEGDHIRAGFTIIDGIAKSSSRKIVNNRGNGYKNMTDLFQKTRGTITGKTVTNLVLSGTMDSIITTRQAAVDNVKRIEKTSKAKIVSLFQDTATSDLPDTTEYPKGDLKRKQGEVLPMFTLDMPK